MENKTSSNLIKAKFKGIWKRNAVISMGLGLVPAVAASSSLKNAAAMSILMAIVLIPTYVVVAFLKIDKPIEYRLPIYAIIASLFYIPGIIITTRFFPVAQVDPFMTYFYILVLDVIVIMRADGFARYNKPWIAAIDGVINVVGFALVTSIIAVFREVLGMGTIWGVKVFSNPASAIRMPMFGFIMVGLLAAVVNAIEAYFDKKKKDQEALEKYDNTFFKKRKDKTVKPEITKEEAK